MGTKVIGLVIGATTLVRTYPDNDPIFALEDEKQKRKMLADAQRDIIAEANRRTAIPVTVRG